MKKTISVTVKVLLALAALLAALLLTHPLWLAPTAKTVANSAVPRIAGTRFELGKLSLNAYSGRFGAGDLVLYNPEGFSEPVALKVGEASVVADMSTVGSDVIRLKEVLVKDVFLAYTFKDGKSNFDVISQNASSGKGAEKPADEKKDAEGAKAESAEGKRVIIDRLTLSGITVKLGPVPLPVPPITLTGIGEKSGGVTFVELGNQLLQTVLSAVGSAKDGLGALGALMGEGVDSLGKQMKKSDLKEAAGAIKSLFK
jgi:hypothetical protein